MSNQSKASILSQQKQQAASQNTPSQQLRELAATGNKAICEKVAANPNTPTDILLKLGAKYPKQLLENPVFSLLLLENPNLLEDIPLDTLISILKEKQAPAFILNTASKHYNRDILILVASNPNTCKNTLEQLANNTYEEVR